MLTDSEVTAIRSRFPVFNKKIYLNSCSQGALCDAVETSQHEQLQSWHDSGSPWDLWVEKYEAARSAFARFIGAEADEVAIISCASAGINSVASALDFRFRNKVVMGEFEFPTMGQIWLAQQRRGLEIQFLESQKDRLSVDAYAKAVDKQTLIVPLTHICFMNGFRSDVKAVAQLAHDQGALVMLDDYQDAGTRPVNVKDLNLDFYVTGALKYLLSPSGIAFLYVRRGLIESLTPTITGWFAQRNPFAFDTKHYNPSHSARRFEAGSPPVPQAYALTAALQVLSSVGLDRIADHVGGLAQKFLAGARELQIQAKTPADSRGPLVVLRMKDAEAMVKKLAEHDIVVSNRMDGLRVSFHVYNTIEDVQAVLRVLEKNKNLTVREPALV
jgi:selenocysteine lyase/cysteine desulfurase